MQSTELLAHIDKRLAQMRPYFQAINPEINVERDIYSGIGNMSMNLLVEKAGIARKDVRQFTLDKIREIDPTIDSSITIEEMTNKEIEATFALGEKYVGDEFADLLFEKLKALWVWENKELHHPLYQE